MKQIKMLLKYLRPYKSRIIISIICMLNVAIFTAVSRWLLKPIIDRVLHSKDIKLLIVIVFVLPIIYLLNGIFVYIKNYINFYVSNNVVKTLREEVYKHLQEISIDYFMLKSPTGKTIAKLTYDFNNIFLMLSKVPTLIVTDIVSVVGLVIVLFYLSLKFAILSLIVFPLIIYIIYIFSKKLRHYSKKNQLEITNLYNHLQESISAIILTKTFAQEKREIEHFKVTNNKVYTMLSKFTKIEILSSPLMEFIGATGVAVILLLGGIDVITGKWTMGSFFAFLAVVLSFYQPVKRIAEINPLVQQGIVSLERVFGILEEKSSVIEVEHPIPAKFNSKIEFINVNFSYDGYKNVLKNISLQIPKGKKIAIVGSSGAGKSTVLNLLLRFYDVSNGEILIDGVNIKNFSLSSLRRLFGVVTQDTFLFNNTIRYNIAYGKEDASDEEILYASKLAYIYDLIQTLPEKLYTVVGERGYTLSGGERQRIAIARVLLTSPEIFIFDEPTSALDSESESIVMQAINNVSQGKTVILITHRLNLVSEYDYIYLFSDGEIVEEGTHDQLLSIKGVYSSLINLQQIK